MTVAEWVRAALDTAPDPTEHQQLVVRMLIRTTHAEE